MGARRVWRAGGAVLAVALVAAVALGGTGPPAVAQKPPAATAALPSCGPGTGPGALDGNPIARDAGVAAVLASFDAALPRVRSDDALASLTAVVVYGREVIYARSVGCADLSLQTPMTAELRVEVGSLTKAFTALMLMQLRDAGALRLDDPVDRYLPGARYLSPAGEPVSPTFLELASHSSGLPRDLLPPPRSVAELLRRLQATTAVSEPGTAFLYSNLGFALLGQVLAHIAGVPYERYVEERILAPLGMTASGFPTAAGVPRVPQPGYATPYIGIAVTADGVAPAVGEWQALGAYAPAGGLYSTAADMTRFLQMVLRGGEPLLAAASFREMQRQVIGALPDLQGIGIGWELYLPAPGLPFIGKDGALAGFQDQLMWVQGTRLGVYVLANTADPTSPTVGVAVAGTAEGMLAELLPALRAAGGD